MASYLIKTLGCKVNQFETDAIALALRKQGWKEAEKNETADVCIINTCTVTGKASSQSGKAIRHIIKKNPNAKIIVTGCYAQIEADAVKKIKGVHSIISHSEKHKIPDMILDSTLSDLPLISENCNASCTETSFSQIDVDVHGKRTRPFLKIQDGCNSFCTYCIVPYTRGRSRSMDSDSVLTKLKALSILGYNEVVLTGIHIGKWGADLNPENNFYQLLKRIEKEKPVKRIRLSSIEPREINDDIINLMAASTIFCNHFHIPLQSGDDNILKRMHRPYDSSFFKQLVEKIHALMPEAAIGADTIIGFPGETDREFDNTYDLIKELPLSYLHVFPFSPRKKTPAASFPDQIQNDIMKQRVEKLRSLGNTKKSDFLASLSGKTVEVLIEKKCDKKTGLLKGISSNYATVFTDGPDSLKNTIAKVKIENYDEKAGFGTIINS